MAAQYKCNDGTHCHVQGLSDTLLSLLLTDDWERSLSSLRPGHLPVDNRKPFVKRRGTLCNEHFTSHLEALRSATPIHSVCRVWHFFVYDDTDKGAGTKLTSAYGLVLPNGSLSITCRVCRLTLLPCVTQDQNKRCQGQHSIHLELVKHASYQVRRWLFSSLIDECLYLSARPDDALSKSGTSCRQRPRCFAPCCLMQLREMCWHLPALGPESIT